MPHQLETTHCVELKFFSINSFYGGLTLLRVLCLFYRTMLMQRFDSFAMLWAVMNYASLSRLTSHRT
jgi:hypothetical protein